MEIKDMILKLMIKHDMTQTDFAHRMGVRPSLVTYWVSGQRKPQVDTVKKMCKVFNVSADWLLGMKGDEDDP